MSIIQIAMVIEFTIILTLPFTIAIVLIDRRLNQYRLPIITNKFYTMNKSLVIQGFISSLLFNLFIANFTF